MVENYAPPSRDPADEDSLLGVLRVAFDKFLMETDDMLPARVIAYDRQANRAQVQPLVQMVSTLGQRVNRGVLSSVPVLQYGGGGFVLSFNLKEGDLGWIKASDRDISLFLQSYALAAPNTKRLHDFSDAVFIPDVMRGYAINGEDAENAVLQTLDGTCRVALWSDKIKLTAPSVVVDTPLATFTGNVQVDGTLHADVDVVADDISGKSHTHGAVMPGAGNSGGPNP
jgi:phage baseplate assembly protein gpV